MKTSNIKITLLALLGIYLTSCSDDFLELAPISQMNENDFYQSEADFRLAVNAAYQTLHSQYGPNSGVSYVGEQMSDEATVYMVIGNVADRSAFKNYTLRADNSVVQTIWNDAFISLNRINTVLTRMEGADFDASTMTEIEGEMRFLRGLYYFNLVRMFGPVPLLERTVSVEESYGVLRSPVTEVYDFIISDLQFAAANLPLVSEAERTGQATEGAAKGILGKVYLTLGDNSSAASVLEDVIDSGEYHLLDNYWWLWDLEHENSSEAVFEVQYVGGPGNPASAYWPEFSPFENFIITNQGGGMNQVTEDLWNSYEDDDPRREYSVNEGYYDSNGTFIPIKFPRKWEDRNVIEKYGNEYCDNNFIVLRYADILLMYAEATQDPTYLNEVRERAGVPLYGTAGYPSAMYPSFDLAIEHERKVELALEFHRWFDLKRKDRVIPVMTEFLGENIKEDELLLPIPQTVIDKNPEISQNPGY